MMKKWIITYFNLYGEVYGPVWETESACKPTRWALRHVPKGAHTFTVKEVEAFSEDGYKDAFLKGVAVVQQGR